MGGSFRPVEEIWGEHSSMFLEHEDVLAVFDELARRTNQDTCTHEYGEVESVYFPEGAAIFDYAETDANFTAKSFGVSLRENGRKVSQVSLGHLLSNLKNMAPDWRKSIDKNGTLTFYVD
jgi:hypothetical protein